jgi:hypothetical protein
MKSISLIFLILYLTGCSSPSIGIGLDLNEPLGDSATFPHQSDYELLQRNIRTPLREVLSNCGAPQSQPLIDSLVDHDAILRAITATAHICGLDDKGVDKKHSLEATLSTISPGNAAELELHGHLWWTAWNLQQSSEKIFQNHRNQTSFYLEEFSRNYPWTKAPCTIQAPYPDELQHIGAEFLKMSSQIGFSENSKSISQLEGTLHKLVVPGIEFAIEHNSTTLALLISDYLAWGSLLHKSVEKGEEPNREESIFLLKKYRTEYRSLWTDYQLERMHAYFEQDSEWPNNPVKPFMAVSLSGLTSSLASYPC